MLDSIEEKWCRPVIVAKDVAVAKQIMKRERVWRRLSQVRCGQRTSAQTWAQTGT